MLKIIFVAIFAQIRHYLLYILGAFFVADQKDVVGIYNDHVFDAYRHRHAITEDQRITRV